MKRFLMIAALAAFFVTPAYAADECTITAWKANPSTKAGGDSLPIFGAHIRPSSASQSIDQGNSESFTVPEGTDYLELSSTTAADNWFRISAAGSSAVVDQDIRVPAGKDKQIGLVYENGEARKIKAGDIVKCIVDS